MHDPSRLRAHLDGKSGTWLTFQFSSKQAADPPELSRIILPVHWGRRFDARRCPVFLDLLRKSLDCGRRRLLRRRGFLGLDWAAHYQHGR